MIRFIQHHPRLAKWLIRLGFRSWIERRVWGELEASPGFTEAMQRAEAELATGKFARFEVQDRFLVRVLGEPETWQL